MSSRIRLLVTILGTVLSALVVVLVARPTAAAEPNRPGLYGPPGDRAADGLVFLYMHETTSLETDGDGGERIEFLVSNSSLTPVSTAEFYFTVAHTNYWGISAWDAQGGLDYQVTVNGDEVHVTLHFRESVSIGEQYRYYFAINFPDLAEEDGNEWTLGWGTYFPVAEFVRTVNLPGGATVTYVNPTPSEQTANYVRWRRYVITAFELSLRYTIRPLTDLELAEMYAPDFRMHGDEIYVPMNVEMALKEENARCFIQPGAAAENCSLGLLSGNWVNQFASYIDLEGDPGRLLNLSGSSHQFYINNLKKEADTAPVVYARVAPVPGSAKKVIQYWLFYYYNSWGYQGGAPGRFGLHEGDWEMVQLVLGADGNPEYAAYAQHDDRFDIGIPGLRGGSRKEWNDLERVNGTHMVVYPALGSHASYFRWGFYLGLLDKTAPFSRPLLGPRPTVDLLEKNNPAYNWVNYLGLWGQPSGLFFVDGPKSPGKQGVKWDNPYQWAESLIDWDEFARYHLGKVRAHISAPCNISLRNKITGQLFGWKFDEFISQIDGGEYIVNETLGTHSLILHNSYKAAGELFTLFATCRDGVTPSNRNPVVPVSLTVELYDRTTDELVTAEFELPANWTPATSIATLEFTDGASPVLEVDRDNDGSIDEIVPPESVVSEPIEEPQGGGQLFVPVVQR